MNCLWKNWGINMEIKYDSNVIKDVINITDELSEMIKTYTDDLDRLITQLENKVSQLEELGY